MQVETLIEKMWSHVNVISVLHWYELQDYDECCNDVNYKIIGWMLQWHEHQNVSKRVNYYLFNYLVITCIVCNYDLVIAVIRFSPQTYIENSHIFSFIILHQHLVSLTGKFTAYIHLKFYGGP